MSLEGNSPARWSVLGSNCLWDKDGAGSFPCLLCRNNQRGIPRSPLRYFSLVQSAHNSLDCIWFELHLCNMNLLDIRIRYRGFPQLGTGNQEGILSRKRSPSRSRCLQHIQQVDLCLKRYLVSNQQGWVHKIRSQGPRNNLRGMECK